MAELENEKAGESFLTSTSFMEFVMTDGSSRLRLVGERHGCSFSGDTGCGVADCLY